VFFAVRDFGDVALRAELSRFEPGEGERDAAPERPDAADTLSRDRAVCIGVVCELYDGKAAEEALEAASREDEAGTDRDRDALPGEAEKVFSTDCGRSLPFVTRATRAANVSVECVSWESFASGEICANSNALQPLPPRASCSK